MTDAPRIVDLKGNAVEHAPEPNRVLAVLKDLIAEIEGGLEIDRVYVLLDGPDPGDRSCWVNSSRDSGHTIAEAVYRLELEKNRIYEAAKT